MMMMMKIVKTSLLTRSQGNRRMNSAKLVANTLAKLVANLDSTTNILKFNRAAHNYTLSNMENEAES